MGATGPGRERARARGESTIAYGSCIPNAGGPEVVVAAPLEWAQLSRGLERARPDEFERDLHAGAQALVHRTGERGVLERRTRALAVHSRYIDPHAQACDAARRIRHHALDHARSRAADVPAVALGH